MGPTVKRRIAGMIVVMAAATAALIVVLAGLGASAGAKTNRHITTVALLALPRGSFEISLGEAPEWMPLSGTAQTLTLIAGAPAKPGFSADNAYVGFISRGARCADTPVASKAPYSTLEHFFDRAHNGSHAGVFAPNGGAPGSSFVDSVPEVVVHQSTAARACIWLAKDAGAKLVKRSKKRKKPKRVASSLVTSIVVPLLNRTFAASVSNLSGATPGSGGYSMYAIDGAHVFRYTDATVQCGAKSSDAATVAAGTPGSESIAVSTAPCSTDESTFRFTGHDVNRRLGYSIADAIASPAVTVTLGGCELDPLTGATLIAAKAYLTAVGCRLGKIEVTPYQKTLTRGAVAWASVDGGVAELAPAQTTVDLVLNGNPA
jgi:hypothetical protein